jgi:hypothetical protein
MDINQQLRKCFKLLGKEREKGNTACDFHLLKKKKLKDPSIAVYLWHAKTIKHKPNSDSSDLGSIFIAYDYYDFRLWGENPISIETSIQSEKIEFDNYDGENKWNIAMRLNDGRQLTRIGYETYFCNFEEIKLRYKKPLKIRTGENILTSKIYSDYFNPVILKITLF